MPNSLTPSYRVTDLPEQVQSQLVEQDGHWLWTGYAPLRDGGIRGGYGVIHVGGRWPAGKPKRVHRYVWEPLVGPIPSGLQVGHICPGGPVRICANPEHLRLMTDAENTKMAFPSACRRGLHPDGPVYIRRNGRRECVPCRRAAVRARRARVDE